MRAMLKKLKTFCLTLVSMMSSSLERKGETVAYQSTPPFCAEILKRNITYIIKDLSETKDSKLKNKLERDYTTVLGVVQDVQDALIRLQKLEFGE